MSYATRDNLDALTGNNATRAIPRRLVDRCMAKADAVVDGKLGVLYGVPFGTPYPALIVSIAEELTLYYLYTFTAFAGVAGNTDEARRELYQSAMDMLDKIVSGDIVLTDVTVASSAGYGTRYSQISSNTEDYHPIFDLDDPVDWDIDDDQLTSIEDGRE